MSVVSERTEKLEEGFDLDRGGGIWDRGSEVWILQDGRSTEMQQLVRSTNKDSHDMCFPPISLQFEKE